MTVTLDATLQTAQDGLDHHPICKIISKAAKGADLPFEGNYFNSDATDEYDPDLVLHSTGRLLATYRKGDNLYLVYCDTDRTTWTEQLIYTGRGKMSSSPPWWNWQTATWA